MSMVPITAAELNYIIYHYLHESGFSHTAFNFRHEAGVNQSPFGGNSVPRAALVRVAHKGLLYIAMEANDSNFGKGEVHKQLSILKPMDLITKDVHELRRIIASKNKNQDLPPRPTKKSRTIRVRFK